jgi:hypothetical protein
MSEGAKMPADAKVSVMNEAGMAEAKELLEMNAKGTGRQSYSPSTGVQFKPSDNVYVKSALAIDFTKGKATVTLPLFKGLSPKVRRSTTSSPMHPTSKSRSRWASISPPR